MIYRIGKYTFSSKEAYEAGLRDAGKIKGLAEEGASESEQAVSLKRQIRERGIVFESVIGQDFEAQIDAVLFANPNRTRRRTVYFISGRKKAVKRILTVLLSTLGVALFAAICITCFRSYESRKSLQKLQETVAAEANAGSISDAANAGESSATGSGSGTDESNAGSASADSEAAILPRYQVLAARNPDFVGWLSIEGTDINYPVMYRPDDNDYYLYHNFDGVADKNGLPVLDKRCAPDGSGANTLIHGHNMFSGAMFAPLEKYEDVSYGQAHPLLSFDTLTAEGTYELVAVFLSSLSGDDSNAFKYYNYIDIEDQASFDAYMNNIKRVALYDTGVTAVYGDKLVTLSTCEYSRTDGRLVLVWRKL